jgi:hypothetical protein
MVRLVGQLSNPSAPLQMLFDDLSDVLPAEQNRPQP